MRPPNQAAQRFLERYRGDLPEIGVAAGLARDEVSRVVSDTGAFVHVIDGRAKNPESLRRKIRRKAYKNAEKELSDLVGVRVISYYRDGVDPIVAQLRAAFEIDNKRSVDKRLALDLRGFGYRSVHLIARFRSGQIMKQPNTFLKKGWFEIQVRSILEHAWAEIEHEVVYKSGIKYPEAFLRRFAGIAGTLELLDGEFLALREARAEIIDIHLALYRQKKQLKEPFDVARLLAFLELKRPLGLSWRQAAISKKPFPAGLDVSCVEAIIAVGLRNPTILGPFLRDRELLRTIRFFAAAEGIAPEEVSHLAIIVLSVIRKDLRLVENHFPEMIFNASIEAIIQRRKTAQAMITRRMKSRR